MHESVMIVNRATPERSITPRQFTNAIVESVLVRHPGVTVADVFGPRRDRHIVAARFEAIAEVAAARPWWSYPTLGRIFGNRDHTTIMHALKRVGVTRTKTTAQDAGDALMAARSVGVFIWGYEATADQNEYRAALSVATFVRLFALPAWARSEGGAQ